MLISLLNKIGNVAITNKSSQLYHRKIYQIAFMHKVINSILLFYYYISRMYLQSSDCSGTLIQVYSTSKKIEKKYA